MGKHLRKIKIVQKQSAPVRPLHRILRHKKREYQPSALQAAGWKPRGFASFTVLLYHHARILSIGFAKIFSAFFANKSHGYQFYPQSVDGATPLWAPCTFAPRSSTVHFNQKEKVIPDSTHHSLHKRSKTLVPCLRTAPVRNKRSVRHPCLSGK